MATVEVSLSERLRWLIEQHQVVYEHWMAKIVKHGELRIVGHDLLLIGTHGGHVTEMTTPGCRQCAQVWQDLREIADFIAPPPTDLSRFRVVPFSHAVHYAKERGNRPDVELIAEIRHRSHYDGPLDACEDRCLKHSLTRLKELGVSERRWQGGDRAPARP